MGANGLSWWLVMTPLFVLTALIVGSAQAGEYVPTKDTSFLGWWAVMIVTVFTVAMMVYQGSQITRWIGIFLLITLVVGGGIYAFSKPKTRTVEVKVQSRTKIVAVQLADPHFGWFTPWWRIAQIIDEIKTYGHVDQFYLTGDNAGLRCRRAEIMFDRLLYELRLIHPNADIFAVRGGHEVEFIGGAFEEILKRHGVIYGQNVWRWSKDHKTAVWCAADSDHKSQQEDALGINMLTWRSEMHRTMPHEADLRVILCHDPDDIDPKSSWVEGADFIVSGHTHRPGYRLIHGVLQITSAGLGAAAEFFGWGMWPIRFRRPQIVKFITMPA